MISVHPYLFFGLADLALILLLGCGVLLWKWRKLSAQLQTIEANWHEAHAGLEATITSLQTGLGADASRRISGIKALQGIFALDPSEASEACRASGNAIMALVSELEAGSADADERNRSLGPESGEEEDARAGWAIQRVLDADIAQDAEQERLWARDYGEMERLVEEQNQHFLELTHFKSAVVGASQKLERVNTANQKLMEHLDSVATDERFRMVGQLVEKLRQGGQELGTLALELEREKLHLEPRIAALTEQNEHLLASLKRQRKQLEKALQDKADLRVTIEEEEKRIAMRNKSYGRLHKKFDALRREYLTLYQLAIKGGKRLQSPSGD